MLKLSLQKLSSKALGANASILKATAGLSFIPEGHSEKHDAGNHNSEIQSKDNMDFGCA